MYIISYFILAHKVPLVNSRCSAQSPISEFKMLAHKVPLANSRCSAQSPISEFQMLAQFSTSLLKEFRKVSNESFSRDATQRVISHQVFFHMQVFDNFS